MSTINVKDLEGKTYAEIVKVAKDLGCFMPKKNTKKTKEAILNRIKNHLAKGGSAAPSKPAAKAKPVSATTKKAPSKTAAGKKAAKNDDDKEDDKKDE